MRVAMDGIVWRKSSFSANGGECVEVSWPEEVAVRDSKAAEGPVLDFPVAGWRKFLATLPR
jgi:hypothetical protein